MTTSGLVVRVPGYRCIGPGFHSQRYQIFWEVVGLKRGQLRLVNTIEELLGRKSSGSGLESREYDRGVPLLWPRDTLYQQKLELTSPTSFCRSFGIIRSRTNTKEFFFKYLLTWNPFRMDHPVVSSLIVQGKIFFMQGFPLWRAHQHDILTLCAGFFECWMHFNLRSYRKMNPLFSCHESLLFNFVDVCWDPIQSGSHGWIRIDLYFPLPCISRQWWLYRCALLS
jgi:hypothetical protein